MSITSAARGNDDVGDAVPPLSRALIAAREKGLKVVAVTADLSRYTDIAAFGDRYPDDLINVGMAENNLVGVAAGLAKAGLVPVASTFATFATRRALDFIAIQCGYERANVKIVAGLPGLHSTFGPTHQGIDDLAHMRAIPNFVVIDPGDPREMELAMAAALEYVGPVYLRLVPSREPVVLDENYEFKIGLAQLLRPGNDVAIVASGTMIPRSLNAASQLAAQGIAASVLNVSTLKPLDAVSILSTISDAKAVVVAENHSTIGGLFSAVSELMVLAGIRRPVEPVGIKDRFSVCASLDFHLRDHRMRDVDIAAAALVAFGAAKAPGAGQLD